jgi:DNA repair protein RecN (Recombination protein N)
MLLNLHVKNLALMEEAEVEFGEGLNILTGETGAGKSIIIGSVNLALGEKGSKEMLREGADYALVELIFGVENDYQREMLRRLDIIPEDNQVIMSRKITASRSVGKINAESVPAVKMREAAALLIDIHGQHEHQSLLQKRKHLEILDEYAKEALAAKKAKLATCFKTYQAILEEQKEAVSDENQRQRELSFLEYEINELEDANLRIGEDEQLEKEYRRLVNGKKILEAAAAAYSFTTGDTDGASDLVGRALRELTVAGEYDPQMDAMTEQLSEIDNLLNDFNRELSGYLSDTEFSQEDLYLVEQRLDEINRLKVKYGDSIEIILNEKQEKEARYEKLIDYERYLDELAKRFQSAKDNLEKISTSVSEIRKRQAKKLSKLIQNALEELNFLDVTFTMGFEKLKDYTANGCDEGEFLISTNPGEPVKSLGKVASGGELSRIMLAIKTILAENDLIETLIFDEIDTGISGRTAQMVAEKMNVIGESHQVICITHLPQIAAMADHHYLIEKSVTELGKGNKGTISTIHKLNQKDSIAELARLLGGVKVTDTVRQSAREMKELAEFVKKNRKSQS